MLYDTTIPASIRALTQLSACLDKAAAFADTKKVEFPVLLNTRLIADQLPLVRQIQIACDTAKFGASRITGKDAPTNDDKEATLAEAKARIDSTIAYLNTFKPEDLGVDVSPRITTLKVSEPPKRSAGIKVPDVATLVDKLKNVSKVI